MRVRRVQIIPVEIVVRNRAAGSIVKRLGIHKGTVFEPPLLEYFYKSDELGRSAYRRNPYRLFQVGDPDGDVPHQASSPFDVNRHLQAVFNEVGLELIDFKLEFGRDVRNGKILLADEFTPDGCRLWDHKTGEPMDKDRFRQDLGGVDEAYQEVHRRLEKYFEGKL